VVAEDAVADSEFAVVDDFVALAFVEGQGAGVFVVDA